MWFRQQAYTYDLKISELLLEWPRPACALVTEVLALLCAVLTVLVFEDELTSLLIPVEFSDTSVFVHVLEFDTSYKNKEWIFWREIFCPHNLKRILHHSFSGLVGHRHAWVLSLAFNLFHKAKDHLSFVSCYETKTETLSYIISSVWNSGKVIGEGCKWFTYRD